MVRNRDVILNADYVKNLANSLAGAPNSTTTPGVEVAKLIIGNEFDNINNLFQKYSASVIYHLIVRSRIEYLLYSLQHLFPRIIETSELGQTQELLQSLYKLLQIAYTLYHQYSVECAAEHTPLPLYDEGLIPQSTTDQVDEDLQKLTDAPEHCTSWMELCMTSACTLLVKALMKTPSLRKALPLSTSESCQLLSSRIPALQALSLHLTLASLQLELEQLTRPRAAQTSSKENRKDNKADRKGVMRRSASEVGGLEKASSVENIKVKETSKAVANRRSRSAYITSQSSGQGLEESFYLIHNGGLRNVLWCMLHTLYEIRHVATMVLRTMCVILHIVSPTTSDPSDKPESNSLNPLSATSLYVLWTACVEQGLVPMLEMIATGFPVCKTGKSSSGCSSGHSVVVFPEMEIQDSARLLLNLMSHQLALHSATSMQVRQKIIQSLTYSGSVLLKKNILLSVIYLCGRSNVLSSFMIHKEFENSLKSSMPSASTCSADDMRINLHTVFHIQSQDSDTVLLLLKHFLTQSLSEHMQLLFDVKTNTTKFTSAKRPKSAPLKKLSEVDMRSWPVILRVVDSQSRNDGVVRSIRMTCPPVEKIEMFFPDLAIRVEVAQKVQYNCLLQQYDMSLKVTNDTIHKLLSSQSDENFEVLYGVYDVWQEIFSHVSDGYVRDSSLAKMSRATLLQCLETAMQYQASPLLIYAYCSYLGMHIQDSSLLETLKVGVAYYDQVRAVAVDEHRVTFHQHSFHLTLIKACIDYALDNAIFKRMMRETKLLQSRQAGEIWQCLQRVLLGITS